MHYLLLVLCLFYSSLSFAFSEAELTTMLKNAQLAQELPGLRAAVHFSDGRVVTSAVGVSDKQSQQALTNTIGMPGGSTGKTFVAALTLLLVEDGILALDDYAKKYLSHHEWYQRLPNADQVQIKHLLSHSSGITDYPGSWRFQVKYRWRALRHGSAKFSREELISFASDSADYQPGQGYRYTDIGYLVLGMVIEAATQTDYYTLLESHILKPANLHQVFPARESVLPNIATGYSGSASMLKADGRMRLDPSSEWTGGGLTTNPTMLVEFYSQLANGKIVAPSSFQQMVTSGWSDPQRTSRYGFGMFVRDHYISHGGLWPGYRSYVVHSFAENLTLALQTNQDQDVDLPTIAKEIETVALRQ